MEIAVLGMMGNDGYSYFDEEMVKIDFKKFEFEIFEQEDICDNIVSTS